MPKKDGTRRMCVEYRKLNSITTNDPYPLPNIEQLIANLGNSSYITTLDLTKGYHQVPVKKDQIEKTAFITPYGKYEYLTMPFGLVTAPSTFQRLMDRILQGLHGFAVAYLDDILFHSSMWEEHLEHLIIVFDKLREAGLTVKETKCTFGEATCVYLGYVVGSRTVKPMQGKVSAIREFSRPRTKREVRSFLGLCGYYRNINNFLTVATPLSGLTRKHAPNQVVWGESCQEAFQHLKRTLTVAPVLVTPDWSKTFILQTDASAYGLGYVLNQLHSQGEEHPIAFASKKLLASERNYSAIEREALAIVKGVQHFRTYLEGNPFTIQTDHNPLTHLNNLKDSHGRLARWALALQPYLFKVEHRSGRANLNADGLSRDPQSAAKVGEVSEPPGLHQGTLPPPQSWQPVKEEMNNKVNKVRVVNCVNEGYDFPVEEVDYENMVWNEDREVLTKNNKDSPNEQLAGQAEAPRLEAEARMARSREHIKDTANYY